MYDVDDEWEYGEKRAKVQEMFEELVLDAIIESLTKIKQRKKWLGQELNQHCKKQIQKEIKF